MLLSPRANEATRRLRQRFTGDEPLVATDRDEYAGFACLLEETLGFQF